MSFFEQDKHSIVMNALNSMILMAQPRLKKLSNAHWASSHHLRGSPLKIARR